jgi:prophage tail gpP-like protein
MKILIGGRECNFFTTGTIILKLDSIASTFEFSCRFSANNPEHQEMLKPLQYRDVEIYNSKDKLIFTGTLLSNRFISDKGRNLVVVSGYSKSGILEDVTIPVSEYPLESNGKSFIEIARRLAGIFNINVVVSDQAKTISNTTIKSKQKDIQEQSEFESVKAKSKMVFGRTSAEPTETIKNYLAKLAGQKNLILSHNEKGEVLIFQPSYNQKPKYFFTKGNSLSMEAEFNGQTLHSEVNVVRQPSDDNEGATTADTAKNNLVAKYRPTTKILSSGEDLDTENSAKNEIASELKDGINVKVNLQGIFDEIYPGEIVNVHNHYIYCYAYNRFMVNEITLKFDEKSDTTELNLVVPESFNGGFIRNILFNHQDEDHHFEPHLNEDYSTYTNRKDIL